MPLLHVAVPLTLLQAMPQAPQLRTSVARLVSQPVAGLPEQFAKPALQVIRQMPLLHVAVPLTLPQAWPQAPQLRTSVATLVSQPVAGLPEQFAKPALQVMRQMPLLHVAVPLTLLQAMPQAPQLRTSVTRLVSHPLAGLPEQLAKPGLQVIWQVPPRQIAVPLMTPPQAGPEPHVQTPLVQASAKVGLQATQAVPLVPQAAIVAGLMQTFLLQQPVGQLMASQTQVPWSQRWPGPHGGPVPQPCGQIPPTGRVAQKHVPELQSCPGPHLVLQLPQWLTSLCVLTQVPLHMVVPPTHRQV